LNNGKAVLSGPFTAQQKLSLFTTTESMRAMKLTDSITSHPEEPRYLDPVSPGELLLEEFLKPRKITKYRLAKEIGVPAQRIGEIIKAKRSITPDTDLRLCRFFSLSDGYWLRAQALYDIQLTKARLQEQLMKIKPWAHVEND
jgi:addiction module HigA family antidote